MKNNWTREETIVALNVYCKVPFKNSNKNHPIIQKYAEILGRSPSALNMKVGNFGRLDKELAQKGIKGLAHGSKLDEEIWMEFSNNWEKLVFESELLIAKFSNTTIEESSQINLDVIKEGLDREAVVKQRVNQNFFRAAILSAYNNKCCISGLHLPELLIASHIVPWSKDINNRLNPRNGLCLNALHDKAFDKGYITITPDYKVKVSQNLSEHQQNDAIRDFFFKFADVKIVLPDKFLPHRDFLDYHNNIIFKK